MSDTRKTAKDLFNDAAIYAGMTTLSAIGSVLTAVAGPTFAFPGAVVAGVFAAQFAYKSVKIFGDGVETAISKSIAKAPVTPAVRGLGGMN